MILVVCKKCGHVLEEPGAVVLGPPWNELVRKLHVCVDCWEKLFAWLEG